MSVMRLLSRLHSAAIACLLRAISRHSPRVERLNGKRAHRELIVAISCHALGCLAIGETPHARRPKGLRPEPLKLANPSERPLPDWKGLVSLAYFASLARHASLACQGRCNSGDAGWYSPGIAAPLALEDDAKDYPPCNRFLVDPRLWQAFQRAHEALPHKGCEN
jgi:hypothetical protein